MNERGLCDDWEQLLQARIARLLRSLAMGDDAPPALRYKAEGCAETGLALGLVDAGQLASLLDRIYAEATGHTIDEQFGYPANECIDVASGQVTLPFRMRRAPVGPASERLP